MSDPSSGHADERDTDDGEETVEDVFADVLDAAQQLDELPDLARVEAWASSVLAIWAEAPDADTIDASFLRWLDANDHPRAGALRAVVDRFLGVDCPPARPLRAWQVAQHEALSLGIGFVLEDGSQYSLLGDLEGDELTSLIVAPGPEELFDGSEDLINPDPAEVNIVARQLVDAWQTLLEGDAEIPESVYVNGALGARRLGEVLSTDLQALFRPRATAAITADEATALAETEVEENAWALSVLDGAGLGPGTQGAAMLSHPLLPAEIVTYPASEREAFGALEWADWLGVILQLERAQVGTVVDPSTLVDFVNQCPEVTSTIPKRDRPYYEWAFSMVLPLWRAGGVLDHNNALLPDGADMLLWAARDAWRAR